MVEIIIGEFSLEKLTKSLEKYLLVIYELIKNNEKVTPKTVGEKIGYNKASTLEGIKNLDDRDLIEYYPYKEIVLTEKGGKYAKLALKKKETITAYLEKFLFLSGKKLENCVDSISNEADENLVNRMGLFIDFLEFCPVNGPKWLDGFKEYTQSGEMPKECASCLEESIAGKKTKCKL